MPGTKHHTDKFRRCVEQVLAKGNSEDSAYAICTTSLQEAGEPIYEEEGDRAAELRTFHLRGATHGCQTEIVDGREHLVVPVIALMEGVIHAVNAEEPEFVPFEALESAAASWEDMPLVVRHPMRNGVQVTAATAGVWEQQGFGKIRNCRADKKKKLLSCEALIDPSRLEALNEKALLADIRACKPIEVSVGAHVRTARRGGVHNGRRYATAWEAIQGDHLAFLPGGRGACSVEMGCGAHRAASYRVSEEGFVTDEPKRTLRERFAALLSAAKGAEEVLGDASPFAVAYTALEERSYDERMSAVNAAVQKRWGSTMMNGPYAYAQAVYDDHAIVRKDDKLWRVPYAVGLDGEVTLGEPSEVRQVYVAASLRAAAGRRNNAADQATIQAAHDHMVALGAECSPDNLRTMARGKRDCPTCGGNGTMGSNPCETCDGMGEIKTAESGVAAKEGQMTKEQRAAAIKALTECKCSGFTAADIKMLEAASDERIEAFRAAAEEKVKEEAAKTKEQEEAEKKKKEDEEKYKTAEQRAADLETRLKAAEAAQIPAEELTSLRALADEKKAQDAATKTALVSQLKAAQSVYSEEKLNAMPLAQLQEIAQLARVETPAVDFSGRGMPVLRNAAAGEDYTPPDPYEAGIKALQSKAVN